MKINELICNTPEMTEEKLLSIIDKNKGFLRKDTLSEICRTNGYYIEDDISKNILDEYDLIQDKKSILTRSRRDEILGFVGICLIKMTKGNE